MSPVLEFLHRVSANPWVYDWIQTVLGQKTSLELIRTKVSCSTRDVIIDVGGGTGGTRSVWPDQCRYVCLDIEMPKLKGFRSKNPGGLGVLGDATRMPFADGAADLVVCVAMVHHLTDEMFEQLFAEALRVLKPGGRVVLLDPVLNRSRRLGLALWRLDRGSNPRSAGELRSRLASRFQVVHWESYAIFHEYVLGIGMRL